MKNTEQPANTERFGFGGDWEMIEAARAYEAAHKIPCRECGGPAVFDSTIRYVCHAHFPPVYTPYETIR